ncbi:Adenylate cyclase, class 3 [Enhydrobacter aerosaccus]|uniref:Adenylate cyclase, class 3 n=1 Tax=Enhydrobacter aerosaccus TaxID=225324 RepID=A0A1T4SVX3_9HYPH|nr:adenylate/guanylate cyclase domain-containing protein [Enhydrobacter aerosaccus]SKA32296.1 Adenylate cyclase, class 3 [Enhydrobacter aerosaccus]
MTAADPAVHRPVRWGLATKLFVILILLGAIAVLFTSILGYVRARQALEETIFNQLTAARETKAKQVEAYFRTVRHDLRLLASSKMVVEAMHRFQDGFEELDHKTPEPDLRAAVERWYEKNFVPEVGHLLGKEAKLADYMPMGWAATYLQYYYIVNNPQPMARRKLLDNPGDGSAYSAAHAIYHPLLRNAATTVGFFDFMLADPKSGRLVYGTAKEVDFATSLHLGPYRDTNAAAAVARCAALPDPSATCLEDFKPYLPSDGLPAAFMAAPVIDQGAVIGVLIAQLSIDEIDRVVTGDRRWRQEGFGATGEAYLVGPDYLIRSGNRLFYEDRDRYFEELRQSGAPPEEIEAIQRYGSPVLHQLVDTVATRAALAGIEGTGQIVGNLGKETLSSWGPVTIPGVKWALIAKIETAEAFAPIYRLQRELIAVGIIALLVVLLAGAWLARSLLEPLRELTAGVRRFAAGDHSAKVAVRTSDEIGQLCAAFNGMVDELSAKNAVIATKNRENEELLLNVLPAPIANRLRGGEQSIADGFAEVSVAFADLVGFTALSSEMPPQEVVTLLNGLFTRFDMAAQELGIEKIKTVGDAYMAVCGLPVPMEDHAERILRMAIRMVHITREHALENKVTMKVRVGVNTGPVVAGVIGRSKYIYDLWGDTVNLASRMESGGLPDTIQVTRPVYEKLKDKFSFEPRGMIEVKGKGSVEAWLLRL